MAAIFVSNKRHRFNGGLSNALKAVRDKIKVGDVVRIDFESTSKTKATPYLIIDAPFDIRASGVWAVEQQPMESV